MSILRILYLKRNQIILLTFIIFGGLFLIYENIISGHWDCLDKIPTQHYDSRGKYLILYNYVKGNKRFDCKGAVTYCTHASLDNLNLIKTISKTYDGPISVAVYSPDEDFIKISKFIMHLRSCYPKVLKTVSFHLVFEVDYFPSNISIPIFKFYTDESLCKPIKNHKTNQLIKKPSYPINVLRNVARDASTTHFIMSVDLPLQPQKDFSTKFIKMINKFYGTITKTYYPVVFVLPAFVIEKNVSTPTNKSTLSQILIRGEADIYQHLTCSQCHAVPEMSYKKWLDKGDYHDLGVAFIAKRGLGWQPFFVGTHSDPRFDERSYWSGIKDRQSQMYSMCLLDYNFFVLDNAFLIYQLDSIQMRVENEEEDYRLYINSVDEDFLKIFGANDKCYLTSRY